MKIRDTYINASSGWWVIDPDTRTHLESNSYRNLRGILFQHRKSNGLSTDGIDQIISQQICPREPKEYCEQMPTDRIVATLGNREPTVLELAGNFTKAIGYWISKGAKTVTEEVFNSRLKTCQSCPFWEPAGYLGHGKCNKCKCSKLKLWMATSRCIMGKW